MTGRYRLGMPTPEHSVLARRADPWRRVATALLTLALAHPALAGERTFGFRYAFTVIGLTPGQKARVWWPVPTTNESQTAIRLDKSSSVVVAKDAISGNVMHYVEAAAGPEGSVALSSTYRVTRRSIDAQPLAPREDLARCLKPDRLVPIDGKPTQFLAGRTLPADDTAKAHAIYDVVYNALDYRKDKPGWGRGDVNWVCDSRAGNCSDFHSLFVSLVRSAGVPAKIEFGFIAPAADKPPKVSNYHCWAFFKPAGRDAWVPVDISKAKNRPTEPKDQFFGHLDADRVTFSTGRDVTLSPPQAGPPLNFFVYPYVEVDGKPWPDDKIVRDFSVGPDPSGPTTRPAT